MARPRKRDNGRWSIRVQVNGEMLHATFDTARECREWEHRVRTEMADGGLVPVSRKALMSDVLDDWLQQRRNDAHFKHSSWVRYECHVRLHIKPYLGHLSIGDITPIHVRRWRDRLVDETTVPTAKASLKVLGSFFSDQQRNRLIVHNPALPVQSPRDDRPADQRPGTFLEPHEVDRIVAAMPERWAKDVVIALVCLGCRIGDLGAMTAGNVDLRRDKILVVDIKTGADRWLPVGDELRTVLRRRLRNLEPGAPLFGKPGWSKFHVATFRNRYFAPAVEKANLGRHVRPHDLRHTTASWLARAGMDAKQVSAYLGHARIQITQDLYRHLFPQEMAEMADAIGDIWQQGRDDVVELRPVVGGDEGGQP